MKVFWVILAALCFGTSVIEIFTQPKYGTFDYIIVAGLWFTLSLSFFADWLEEREKTKGGRW